MSHRVASADTSKILAGICLILAVAVVGEGAVLWHDRADIHALNVATDTRGPVGPVGPRGPVGPTGPSGVAGQSGVNGAAAVVTAPPSGTYASAASLAAICRTLVPAIQQLQRAVEVGIHVGSLPLAYADITTTCYGT